MKVKVFNANCLWLPVYGLDAQQMTSILVNLAHNRQTLICVEINCILEHLYYNSTKTVP